MDASYSGIGIGFTHGHDNRLMNCIVYNAQAEGIAITGDHNLLDNCHAYCDEEIKGQADGTDHYIPICGNRNVIRNCSLERVGPLEHIGHGLGFKGHANHNLVEHCTAVNLAGGGFYVRWRGVHHNRFVNCRAIGSPDKKTNDATGFLVREGAHNNLFESCVADGCEAAVRTLHGGEDTSRIAAKDNTFSNCTSMNSNVVFDLNSYLDPTPIVVNNRFVSCTIYNADLLLNLARKNEGCTFVNSIIMKVRRLSIGSEKSNVGFEYTDFFQNGFPAIKGRMNVSCDPHFVEAKKGNFSLKKASKC
ncbi:MAG: right-handed parallel beta-helix repeat-containing protein [Planctomycetes bacterium]|nr:right-handed parallel beta-helix repeat-containing protein [Planctomycetota bacterium]